MNGKYVIGLGKYVWLPLMCVYHSRNQMVAGTTCEENLKEYLDQHQRNT